MAISDNIKICRLQQNMTQKQLGDLLYVSDKTISKWESGRSIPDIYTIKKIADILKVNYEILIDGDQYTKNNGIKQNVILNFFKLHKTSVIISSMLMVIHVSVLFVSAYVGYFTVISTLFLFIIYAFFKFSKWYVISFLGLLIPMLIQLNSLFPFELSYVVIVLFFSALTLFIIQMIRSLKEKNDSLFADFIGNLAIILSILVFISSFNLSFHGNNANLELIVSKKTGFIVSILTTLGLLLLHQYLYANHHYQKRVVQFIKSKWIVCSIGFMVVMMINVVLATGIKLAMDHIELRGIYVGNSYYDEDYRMDQINQIKEIYGEDNVTIAKYVEVTTDLQIYAYTSNFLTNGVVVNPYAGAIHIEEISLLYGSVWDDGSQEKVIVVDEDTAMNTFDRVDVVGEYISINQESWEIIGVVTNTTARQSFLKRAISNGVDPNEIQLDSYAYIPYHYKDYESFELNDFLYDMLIIKDNQIISNDRDAESIIEILVDGNNYYTVNGERFTKISVITGNSLIEDYISLDFGLLITVSLLVVSILIIETRFYIIKFKKSNDK